MTSRDGAPRFHIAGERFGYIFDAAKGRSVPVDPNSYIGELLVNAPKLNAADAHRILISYYETDFRVFDHVTHRKSHPLASVSLHDAENNSTASALYKIIERFGDSNIAEYFNLSLEEFLMLPREYVNLLFQLAQKRMLRQLQTIGKTEKELAELRNKN